MSVQVGDRATYRGESVIVIAPVPFLAEKRWHVRYRNGEAMGGWTGMVALESDLTSVTTPTWEVGDSVRVGYTPYRTTCTITGTTTGGGRTLYEVTVPAETKTTPDGFRWERDAYTLTLGAEHLDTGP